MTKLTNREVAEVKDYEFNAVIYSYVPPGTDTVVEFRMGEEDTEADYELDFLNEFPMGEIHSNQDLVDLHTEIRNEIRVKDDDEIDPEIKYAMKLLAEKAEQEEMRNELDRKRKERDAAVASGIANSTIKLNDLEGTD